MTAQVHGVLVEVLGTGVLILGSSGIGKSECALELLTRGHRLVADDVVRFEAAEDGALVGSAPQLIRHHMEVRGIGIVDVPRLYGPESVRDRAPVDLVCRIVPWKEGMVFERVGLDRPRERVAGHALPAVVLPARPSGNMATLVELAVRDHQDRSDGDSAARRLDGRVQREALRREEGSR